MIIKPSRLTRRTFAQGVAAAALSAPLSGPAFAMGSDKTKPGDAAPAPLTYIDAATDWNNRKSAAGVTYACDFSGADDFAPASTNGGHVFAGGMDAAQLAQVVRDTSDGLTNGCCLRIDKPATEGTGSCEWMCSFDPTWTENGQDYGLGNPIYIQFRYKIPASRLVLSNCGGNQRGWKWMNIAQYSPTNTQSKSFANSYAQLVLQDTDQLGVPQAYHRDPAGSYPPFLGSVAGTSAAGVYKTVQNAIDRGRKARGRRYCEVPSPYTAASAGCEFWPTDEWMTFLLRILPASYTGGKGNRFDLYLARAGAQSWTHLISEADFELGDPDSNGSDGFKGLNGIHLLTYESQRINSTVDTWHKYDQLIISRQDIAIPLDSGVPA